MTEENEQLKKIVEGAILAAGEALSIQKIQTLFVDGDIPEKETILEVIQQISESCEGRGFSLVEVASGWRFRVNEELSQWVNRLWDERPQKYSRALLETLSLVAYRQPLTRGDIEEVRGVAVSSHIIKTLTERDWVKVVGHRDVPGRPALYATTRAFLDYFNLKSLDELPILGELKDIESLTKDLEFGGAPAADGKNEEGEVASSAAEVDGVDSESGSEGPADGVNDSPEDEVSLGGDSSAEAEATESSGDIDESLENIDSPSEKADDSLTVDDSLVVEDSLSDADESLEEEISPSERKSDVTELALHAESAEALFDESDSCADEFGLGERDMGSVSSASVVEDIAIAEDETDTPAEISKPSYASLFQDSSSAVDEPAMAPTENNGQSPEGEEPLENSECDENSDSSSDSNKQDETDNFEQTAQPDEAPVND